MSKKLAAPLRKTQVTEQAVSFETYANTNDTARCRNPEEDTVCLSDVVVFVVVVPSFLLICHNKLTWF